MSEEGLYKYYKNLEESRATYAKNISGLKAFMRGSLRGVGRIFNLIRLTFPSTLKSIFEHIYYSVKYWKSAQIQEGHDKKAAWTLKYRIAVSILKSWLGALRNARKIPVKVAKIGSTDVVLRPKIFQIQKTTSYPVPVPKDKALITQASFESRQTVIDFLYVTAKGEWPDHAANICTTQAEWVEYLPSNPDRSKIVIFFHGGAHILGSKEIYRFMSYRIAQSSGASLFVVNYRLAPSNPYPCALIDAVSAILYVQEAYPLAKILLAGDSAGGNLAVAAMLVSRDMNIKQVDGAWLLSPWLDLTHSSPSIKSNAVYDYLPSPGPETNPHTNALHPQRKHFYVSDTFLKTPYVSPLFATDVTQLPPMLIQCGGAEIMRDEDVEFARRVDCRLEEYRSHAHNFQIFGAFDVGARKAIKRGGDFIRMITDGSSGAIHRYEGHFIYAFNGDLVGSNFKAKL